MITEKLTGQARHRLQTGIFQKPILVLQVEVSRVGKYYTPDPSDLYGHDVDEIVWRDAVVEDLAVIYG